MARSLAVVLALCALAASATAFSGHGSPAQMAELSVSHNDVQAMVEEVAAELEKEAYALLAEANRHHSLASINDIGNCIQVEFEDIVAAVARVLDLIDTVREVADDLFTKYGECKGNFAEVLTCRISVLSNAVQKVAALRAKVKEILEKVQVALADFKKCIASPTTVAPTAAPTEAPTAAPTEVPTEAPTEAPTPDVSDTPRKLRPILFRQRKHSRHVLV